jgi:hypothetical protein
MLADPISAGVASGSVSELALPAAAFLGVQALVALAAGKWQEDAGPGEVTAAAAAALASGGLTAAAGVYIQSMPLVAVGG